MSAETHPSGPRPGPRPHVPAVEEAGGVMHRELIGALRAFGDHLFGMAALVEAEPLNDAAMMVADERFGALHARLRASSEKFMHARFCVGGIQ